jgi:sulfhydrogenase subunit beta (sulfur reductase)
MAVPAGGHPGAAREQAVISRASLGTLIAALASDYRLIGPTVRDGAILYDEIRGAEDLPEGWSEHQEAGRYRLVRRADRALFGFAGGPGSFKRFLHPPRELLWSARRAAGRLSIEPPEGSPRKLAFLGLRACDLAAMAIQSRVFLGGPRPDAAYEARRRDAFVVAVNCGRSGRTCFCASMGCGPVASDGFDLALTELIDDARHEFLIEVGTEAGGTRLASVPVRAAMPADLEAAADLEARVRGQMGRTLDTAGIRELLQESLTDPHWEDAGLRCLGCGNCTMVCPTCFCTTVEDRTDLGGTRAERVRRWDSCFALDFSHLHGGSVRRSVAARYRQWLTHKLAGWIDQFGICGCVGCGRCITWCPVGIDLTEELAALRAGGGGAGGA